MTGHVLISGPASLCRSIWDDRLVEYGLRLLTALDWVGVAMVEFKRNSFGGYRLMEVNPRFWGALPLVIAAGVDYPTLLYRVALGERVKPLVSYARGGKPVMGYRPGLKPAMSYRRGVRMRYLFLDLLDRPGIPPATFGQGGLPWAFSWGPDRPANHRRHPSVERSSPRAGLRGRPRPIRSRPLEGRQGPGEKQLLTAERSPARLRAFKRRAVPASVANLRPDQARRPPAGPVVRRKSQLRARERAVEPCRTLAADCSAENINFQMFPYDDISRQLFLSPGLTPRRRRPLHRCG